MWLNGTNDWIYPHLHAAAEQHERAGAALPERRRQRNAGRWIRRRANCCWRSRATGPFIMKTGTSVDYAVRRFKTHLHRFHRLTGMAESGHYDEGYLREIGARDSLFPDMDYRIFQTRPW